MIKFIRPDMRHGKIFDVLIEFKYSGTPDYPETTGCQMDYRRFLSEK
jgi:hypothetical protein